MTLLAIFLLSALLVQFFYLVHVRNALKSLQDLVSLANLGVFDLTDLWVVVDEETDTVECLTLCNYQALELERGYAEMGRRMRSTKLAGYLADTYWKGAYDYREATRQSLEAET